MIIEEKIKSAAETLNPKDYEPFVRRLADDVYERLLYTVQDYLRENTQFNIQADIDQARNAAGRAETRIAEIADALGVSRYSQEAILGRIETLNDRYSLYDDLLMSVATKYEGEPRHETALRYIREREAGTSNQDISQ